MPAPVPTPTAFTDAVFHYAVEQSAIAISITDENATILYVNPAFCTITGYAADEVVGRNQSLLSYKSTPKAVYQELWSALNRGRSWTGRLLNRRKDGRPYVAELTVTPLHTPEQGDGGTHYLGMHWDATEEHRLGRQLANHKQLIESVISVAPVAVALLDGNGKVVLDNPAYHRIAMEMRVAEPAHAVMSALQQSLGESFHHAVTHRRPLANHELRFERPGGGEVRWYSCSLTWFEERSTLPDAFYGDDRTDYQLLVMHDISASKRQEEALRLAAMRAVLSEGELNQSLREALAGAIFQLQGPVNLISAAAALQKRRVGLEAGADPLSRALADAQSAGEQAIATLQAAMPPEPLEPSGPVNLNEVLRDVLMLETDALLSAGITVDWHPAHVLPSVQGDPAELRNLFRQLIGNAIEAMNVRGWSERALFLSTAAHDGQVEAEIVDTGPGIPEELRLKIFEPFFSTKPARGGARGVGLSLAQEIVSRHRGILEFDPHHTGGTRLRVSFPATRSMAPAAEAHG
ncbi:nitrogen fixation negative regulator NifL [Pseudothauera rhizosphaerae]|uniref:histidine kinase n=1 Tax=Pseudothauera rhizosphaerae TaxID=2565932 RepID=A0A4S4AS52_9RHOO|nr:nitrogen fixation negative regulator NifL [Pseudothauera rhizosphaerae]THF62213.1 nitrogen fixation negative regulator NifL [Pseudothauera rhizosphaerae]